MSNPLSVPKLENGLARVSKNPPVSSSPSETSTLERGSQKTSRNTYPPSSASRSYNPSLSCKKATPGPTAIPTGLRSLLKTESSKQQNGQRSQRVHTGTVDSEAHTLRMTCTTRRWDITTRLS